MYMELEVQCTCMYDKKNVDFIFQKHCFCFLLIAEI